MRKRLMLLLGSLLCIATVIGILKLQPQLTGQLSQTPNYRDRNNLDAVQSQTNSSDSAAADPFIRLTIPYLRQLTYQTSLGEQTEIASTAQYTSYLTEYQSEGLTIHGLLTIPTGQEPDGGWPAIVFVHGYIPPSSYRTTEKYVDYVAALAKSGFVVFKIDLRGHGSSEGEANGAYYSSDYVIDVLNARAALGDADFVNANEIGLWGHSMAGNVVLRALAVKPEIPATVIWAGAVYSYSDWKKYGLSDHSFVLTEKRRSDREAERAALFTAHGEFDSTSGFWQQVSATNYLNEIAGAIQLHHAVDDAVVNIGYSRDLASMLDQTSVPHEFYEYPSGGHNISGSSFSLAMQRSIDFFQTNLDR